MLVFHYFSTAFPEVADLQTGRCLAMKPLHFALMRAPAALVATAGAFKPDALAELRPVRRIKWTKLGADWQMTFYPGTSPAGDSRAQGVCHHASCGLNEIGTIKRFTPPNRRLAW
jgi:hypothetical protein